MRGRDGVYLFEFHARDADVFAERYDVPVYLPTWMDRVAEKVEARMERYSSRPGE